METKFYHYTHNQALSDILESGHVKLATASAYKKEKPVAWVSSNPHWENTATKMVHDGKGNFQHLTFKQQFESIGCTRIEINSKILYTWAKLRHKTHMHPIVADSMEKVGIQQGANPKEWLGSLYPIHKKHWLGIEIFKDGEWKKFEIENARKFLKLELQSLAL